jgi:tripeptide aminopeptidase
MASDEGRLLDTFLELVRIDSPSGEEGRVAAHIAQELTAAGMEVRFDEAAYEAESETGNLLAWLEPTVPGRTVVLSAHMDTVEPGRGIRPVVAEGVVRSGGDTILGADAKSGVAVIIESMRRLRESGDPHAGVRVVLTVREECGLKGAKELSPDDVEGDLCLVLDADGEPGGIVTAAPTHYTFAAVFRGRAAHAGVEPEKGRSALEMIGHAIAAMRLGRIDDETTANIGRVEGGTATNVVAAGGHMLGECRSLDPGKAEAMRREMDLAMVSAAREHGGTATVSWTKEYDGFRFDPADPLLALVEEACRDAGLSPRRFHTGGGSDGNVLSSKGLPTLVVACGMHQVHGTSENIAVADMEAMVRLLGAVLRRAVD